MLCVNRCILGSAEKRETVFLRIAGLDLAPIGRRFTLAKMLINKLITDIISFPPLPSIPDYKQSLK